MRRSLRALLVTVAMALVVTAAAQAAAVGTSFSSGFPTIVDASLGVPVIGFGAAGPVERTPVIFLHGNNDTPYATLCNPYGNIHDFAQYFLDHGYAASELWGLGYQGDQCDLLADQTHRSGVAHTTLANIPDLRAFVHAVLDYTGAKRVDIVGHSLGVTLARAWMKQDHAWHLVRRLVAVDGPNRGATRLLAERDARRRGAGRSDRSGSSRPVPPDCTSRDRKLAADVAARPRVPHDQDTRSEVIADHVRR